MNYLSWEIRKLFHFSVGNFFSIEQKKEINSIFYLSQGHTTSSDFFIERIGQVSSTSVPHITCICVVVDVEPLTIGICKKKDQWLLSQWINYLLEYDNDCNITK